MAQEEQVLVVKREAFERAGAFQGIEYEVDRYLNGLFVPGVPLFMSRSFAENDPSFKQLIPYVIMTCAGKYLTYVRGKRAGETRLVGLRSIGIGGHVNPADDMPLFNNDFREAYFTAVERGVAEEVCVEGGHTDRVVALLNDDSNEVGRVHLGIVHLWALDRPMVAKKEQMITQIEFMALDELRAHREEMETWSQLCLDSLAEMAKRSGAGIR